MAGALALGASLLTAAAPAQAASVHGLWLPPRQAATSRPPTRAQCLKLYASPCYRPAQIQRAYHEGPLFARGITGRGRTIVIVDSFGSPTIRHDLRVFDRQFRLPAPPSFRIIQPAGPVPPYDPNDPERVGWAGETTLDIEWAHSIAPGARLLLVETPVDETTGTTGFPEIVRAENYVINHHLGDVISQSFGTAEQTFPTVRSLLRLRSAYINAARQGVTVLAAAGDDGPTSNANADGTLLFTHRVVDWPASDPLVTAVGGTQLQLTNTGRRTAPDQVWNDSFNTAVNEVAFGNPGPNANATGGGRSVVFGRPRYQDGVAGIVGRRRGIPDISMSAACSGVVDLYTSFGGQSAGWTVSCGTSESSPLFAGIVALADQVAGHSLGLINPALYALAARRAPGLADITRGNNAVAFKQGGKLVTVRGFRARRGYDLASGTGTVNAALFVPELARAARAR
jgi:subtilase family serine protease